MSEIMMPGGEMAKRPLNFFWVVDCSGSMSGSKIGTVNYTIQQTIPEMKQAADENTNAQLYIQAMKFDTGAQWITQNPVKIEDYTWQDMQAYGLTSLGAAFELLCGQLSIPPMSERALPPVIVLLSDGEPTDNYKDSLQKLLSMPWGKKAVRIAIAIGEGAEKSVLEEFTGNPEYVLEANNATALASMIKWASTVAKQVSSPASKRADVEESANQAGPVSIDLPPVIDMNTIDIDADDVW